LCVANRPLTLSPHPTTISALSHLSTTRTHTHTSTWLAVAPCACQLFIHFALRNASAASVQIHAHAHAAAASVLCACVCVCRYACENVPFYFLMRLVTLVTWQRMSVTETEQERIVLFLNLCNLPRSNCIDIYVCMYVCAYVCVCLKRKSFQTIAKLQLKMLRASAMETYTNTLTHTHTNTLARRYTGSRSLLTVIVVDLTIVDTPCFKHSVATSDIHISKLQIN